MTMSSTSADCITILVKDQHDHKLFYKIHKGKPVKKVLMDFCKRTNVDFRSAYFLLNGSRFDTNLTINQLDMESEDEIEVMSPMLGGGC
ncbi:small ubiquitin-related modifier 5-like [Helianthus annuus]|uniref:small ubiquitin-related modifier 5-like n=1 Tax=Helianthus annuus TaxID=4232 RepID=UPI000B907216|nr:small ubiquitin-related modifier 5-like [Helianthus annuus]